MGTLLCWAGGWDCPHGAVQQQEEPSPEEGQPPGHCRGELLLHTQEDLSQLEFEKFWDALAHGGLGGRSCIPWGRLEKADCTNMKNITLDFYGREGTLDVAITILEHIQVRNAAVRLRESRQRALGSAPLLGSLTPDFWRNYKKAILQAYSCMKDQNARVGDTMSLSTRYSKLVIINKHCDKEEQEDEIMAMQRPPGKGVWAWLVAVLRAGWLLGG